MPDLVCYTASVPALVDEAEAKGFSNWLVEDDDGSKSLAGAATPLQVKWPEAVAVVRITDIDAMAMFTNLVVLGQYADDVFLPVSPTAEAVYNRLYPRTVVTKQGLDGEDIDVAPPMKIGEIA